MDNEVTSKRVRNATELMLLIPVRNGFVDGAERLTSYATRLSTFLNSLFEPRRVLAERERLLTADPIDSLKSIYASQWAVVERPGASLLMVSATFDRSWEDYFHILVDKTGALLDAIFCHCEGYAEHTCLDHGFEPFARWIRRHQIPCSFFYSAAPDLTSEDMRQARRLLSGGGPVQLPLESLQQQATRVQAERSAERKRQTGQTDEDLTRSHAQRVQGLVAGYCELSRLFPESERVGERNARTIFNDAARTLLGPQLSASMYPGLRPDVLTWVQSWQTPAQPPRSQKVELTPDQASTIQGNILLPYPHGSGTTPELSHGCVLLLQSDDAPSLRALLQRMRPHITPALPLRGAQGDHALRVNLALTYAGLVRLELPASATQHLPKEFKEGMAARASAIGDVGFPSHPDFWQLPEMNWPEPSHGEHVTLSTVDVVLVVQGTCEPSAFDHEWSSTHPLASRLRDLGIEGAGTRILHVQALRRFDSGGHFGMVEGANVGSQPIPDVKLGEHDLPSGAPARDVVPLGELLLGYPDRRGRIAECARHQPTLFHNGSFMALRKLVQDVGALDEFLTQNAARTGGDKLRVKSWMLGRSEDGTPLTPLEATSEGANDFDYRKDPGVHCPYHAHIRLANPRSEEETVPRIMRRGFSYGAHRSDGSHGERGLLFMAYNASIAGQFEVVQRWLNGGNSTGLPSVQNDLLAGVPQPSAARWVMDNGAWKQLTPPDRPLVALRWGLYLFVPSLTAIDELANASSTLPTIDGLVSAGRRLVDHLESLEEQLPSTTGETGTTSERAQLAWKEALEENPRTAAAIWTFLRQAPKPRLAPSYGLLVADLHHAKQVLSDKNGWFSVREYRRRFEQTIGAHYLGLDPTPSHGATYGGNREGGGEGDGVSYELRSASPNKYVSELNADRVFGTARDLTCDFLEETGEMVAVDLRTLTKLTVARLSKVYLGIPVEDEALLSTIEHFILVSRYTFQPYPDATLASDAKKSGEALRSLYDAEASLAGPMANYLTEVGGDLWDSRSIKLAVMGAIVGFAPPAIAGLLGVLLQWLDSGELYRARQRLSRDVPVDDLAMRRQLISSMLLRSLVRTPVPPILYRTAQAGNPLGAKEGTMVIVGLQALALGDTDVGASHAWLFGGQPCAGNSVHGCPARSPAISMLSGVIDALLACLDITRVSRFAIAFRSLARAPRVTSLPA